MPAENAPILGTMLHAVGAASAALCYTPQRFLHKWSWQTYLLFQASMCWLVLPWISALLTIPELGQVLDEARAHGAGYFEGNVIYLFSNSGAFTTTIFYAGWIATRHGSWREFKATPDGQGLIRNYLLAFSTGLMWYL